MRKKYRKSPLIEMLCEFYFAPSISQDLDNLINELHEKLQAHFPKKTYLQLQASQITIDNSGAPGLTEQLLPLIRFQSSNEQALIQVGHNFLAINHLKPSTSWDAFLPSVHIAWNAYRETVRPETIQRIALRSINRIDITNNYINLEDYFDFRPFMEQKLLQDISAFTLGIQIPYEETRDSLNVQLASITSESPNTVATILDLTYSLTRLGDIAFDGITQWLVTAHGHIEDAFEACITNQLRSVLEEVTEC
jgi:uncharacterized protein (TIGR04255 family)